VRLTYAILMSPLCMLNSRTLPGDDLWNPGGFFAVFVGDREGEGLTGVELAGVDCDPGLSPHCSSSSHPPSRKGHRRERRSPCRGRRRSAGCRRSVRSRCSSPRQRGLVAQVVFWISIAVRIRAFLVHGEVAWASTITSVVARCRRTRT